MATKPRIVSGAGSSTSSAAAKGVSLARNATTNSDIENVFRHIDTQISAVRSEMKGEIATVMATIREAEAQRSLDYSQLKTSLDGVRTSLPTTGTMWKIVGTVVGGSIAALGLLWTIFGAGASLTGSFADRVLEQKSEQQDIQKKLDQLIEGQANDDAEGSKRAGKTASVRKGT